MPNTTSGFYYADASTPMSAEDISAAEASAAQAVIDDLVTDTRQWQNYRWLDSSERNAQTGMRPGDTGVQLDTLRLYIYNGTSWRIFYSGGLVPIVPSAVSGSGVSLDTATGLITTSSATTISIDDCFTNEFRNYRIFAESTGASSSVVLNMRVGGVDSSTNYDRTELLARNGTVTSATTLNGSNAIVVGIVNTLIQADMDLSGPFLTVPTTILTRGGIHGNPAASSTANGIAQNFVSHRPSTSYDGVTLTYSGAQSGTIRVYGYA